MPLDPKTHEKMKVLSPQNRGEITPKNEGYGFHGNRKSKEPGDFPNHKKKRRQLRGATIIAWLVNLPTPQPTPPRK